MASRVDAERDAERARFLERLRSYEGVQREEPLRGPDEVNPAMIRHWCDAIGDENPAYTDEGFAAGSIHGGIVAPPTMLQAWVMPGLRGGGGAGSPHRELLAVLAGAGFASIVATDCEQEFDRYLRPGDRIAAMTVTETVSDEKRTGLGDGYFLTTRTTYTDQQGAVVGTQRFRMFAYRPAGTGPVESATDANPALLRPRPAMNEDTSFFWDGVGRGELLAQRCASCGTLRHPPRPSCGVCGALGWEAIPLSGRGTVYSYAVHHHPPVPGFAPPFVVVLVQLEEGLRIVSNLLGVAPAGARIGMPVEVVFEAVDDHLTLPLFRPREAT